MPAVGKLVAPLHHWDALTVVARELVLSENEGRQKKLLFFTLCELMIYNVFKSDTLIDVDETSTLQVPDPPAPSELQLQSQSVFSVTALRALPVYEPIRLAQEEGNLLDVNFLIIIRMIKIMMKMIMRIINKEEVKHLSSL